MHHASISGSFAVEVGVPLRLLGIGLPLTIALGALAAAVVFDQLTVEEAVILAVVLAPTDAALGTGGRHRAAHPRQDPPGPQRRERPERRDLRAAAVRGRGRRRRGIGISDGRSAGTLLLEEIGFGVVGGVIGGLVVAAIVIHAGRRDLIDDAWRQVIPPPARRSPTGSPSGSTGRASSPRSSRA